MKKSIGIIVLLFLVIATPSYAFNLLDDIMYRKDAIHSMNAAVLVNRFTGEVKYLQQPNGNWLELTGQWKDRYQKMYNAQNARKR